MADTRARFADVAESVASSETHPGPTMQGQVHLQHPLSRIDTARDRDGGLRPTLSSYAVNRLRPVRRRRAHGVRPHYLAY